MACDPFLPDEHIQRIAFTKEHAMQRIPLSRPVHEPAFSLCHRSLLIIKRCVLLKPEATFFPHICRCSRERSPFCFPSRSLAYPASINGPTPALQDIGRSRSSLLQSVLEERQWISTTQPQRLRPAVPRPLREG